MDKLKAQALEDALVRAQRAEARANSAETLLSECAGM
jgi:hypothetical protein